MLHSLVCYIPVQVPGVALAVVLHGLSLLVAAAAAVVVVVVVVACCVVDGLPPVGLPSSRYVAGMNS